MHRRNFIRTTCGFCALAGSGLLMNFLSSCNTTSIFKTEISENKVTVPASLLAVNSLQIIQPHNYGYNIALRKETDGSYTTLLLSCTHADNQLISTGNGFNCNLHGSRFDISGNVMKGPAELSLKKLKTELLNNNIIIHLS